MESMGCVNFECVASYNCTPRLSYLAARQVAKCLVYEDPLECSHYRWDPIDIWKYKMSLKQKKNKKWEDNESYLEGIRIKASSSLPWKDLKKFRDWWWKNSSLGSFNSVLRCYIVNALEQLSWTSTTEEEYVLFLLIQLIVETKIELGSASTFEIPNTWCNDLAQIVLELGPFPLQKLVVKHDAFGIKPLLTALVKNAPKLQILKINQWALSNDFMEALRNNCTALTDFVIPSMQPQVFMHEGTLFSCFFGGMSREDVVECCKKKITPSISFNNLRLVDILYWEQTFEFLHCLSFFCPQVRLYNIYLNSLNVKKEFLEFQNYFNVKGAKFNALCITCRTRGIFDESLEYFVNNSINLKEMKIHVDDNFDGADIDFLFEKRLEEGGGKLKRLVSQISSLDSLALRPHEGVDITKIVLPLMGAQGCNIRCLQFCYEFSPLNSNILYQLINLCPLLHRLIIATFIVGEDCASTSFKTKLRPLVNLDTLVMVDISSEYESDLENSGDSVFIRVANNILESSPYIKEIGLSMSFDMDELFCKLKSNSARSLHLDIKDIGHLSQAYFFFQKFLPNFPKLQTLSLEENEDILNIESLKAVCSTGIVVTRSKPEFFCLPMWESTNGSVSSFNVAVM
ncbi:unnamed protein product [Meganyctiphanes norvegica]|uniref:Uncharacterized protein n=1 Tax=Meganyctiphanes norvegica TaxID=48144 RepID=A0AAV2SJE6_MEGNR